MVKGLRSPGSFRSLLPIAALLAASVLPLHAARANPFADATVTASAVIAEDVRFAGGAPDIELAGTLERPAFVAREQPVPAVVLIHGSGPNDRDETMYGHKPFRQLSALLVSAGYAVLRYDKRGVGESGGTLAGATVVDFAADAEAAFDWLRRRADIDGHRVGLLGHSEGGVVAPMIAVRRPEVAWLVLLAPPSVNGREISSFQNIQGAIDRGASEVDAEAASAEACGLFDILQADHDPETRDLLLTAALQRIGARRRYSDAFIDAQRRSLTSPWFTHILRYDPAKALRRLRTPTLVLYAALDHQVAPSLNEGPAREALKDHPSADIRVLPGVNHLFLDSHWGAVAEYARLRGGLAPVLGDTLGTWLGQVEAKLPTYTAQR
jgi:pimeloyl-ACP methyl ester carboxylesterase